MRHVMVMAFAVLVAAPAATAAATCTDGAIEWAGPSVVVGWLRSPPSDPASSLELVLNRGGARERHVSGALHRRPDLYPAMSSSPDCGFAFWLPTDIGPGPHGAEVRVRETAGGPWLHVDTAVIDEATVVPYGGCQIMSQEQMESPPGAALSVRLWVHDQRRPEFDPPLDVVVRFRDQVVAQLTVANFCPGAYDVEEPACYALNLYDVSEGGPLVISYQPDPSEPETVIAAWLFEP